VLNETNLPPQDELYLNSLKVNRSSFTIFQKEHFAFSISPLWGGRALG